MSTTPLDPPPPAAPVEWPVGQWAEVECGAGTLYARYFEGCWHEATRRGDAAVVPAAEVSAVRPLQLVLDDGPERAAEARTEIASYFAGMFPEWTNSQVQAATSDLMAISDRRVARVRAETVAPDQSPLPSRDEVGSRGMGSYGDLVAELRARVLAIPAGSYRRDQGFDAAISRVLKVVEEFAGQVGGPTGLVCAADSVSPQGEPSQLGNDDGQVIVSDGSPIDCLLTYVANDTCGDCTEGGDQPCRAGCSTAAEARPGIRSEDRPGLCPHHRSGPHDGCVGPETCSHGQFVPHSFYDHMQGERVNCAGPESVAAPSSGTGTPAEAVSGGVSLQGSAGMCSGGYVTASGAGGPCEHGELRPHTCTWTAAVDQGRSPAQCPGPVSGGSGDAERQEPADEALAEAYTAGFEQCRRRAVDAEAEVERLTEQRDAYADTLANIAESGKAEDVPAALIAQMTLDQQGYLPFGRLRETEAQRDAVLAQCQRLTKEVARYRAAVERIVAETKDYWPNLNPVLLQETAGQLRLHRQLGVNQTAAAASVLSAVAELLIGLPAPALGGGA